MNPGAPRFRPREGLSASAAWTGVLLFALAGAGAPGLGQAPDATAGGSAEPVSPGAESGSAFLRFVEDKRGARLQTAIVTYGRPDGAVVHLVAAVHLAEKAYYRGLEETFKSYDALLYELVTDEFAEPHAPAPEATGRGDGRGEAGQPGGAAAGGGDDDKGDAPPASAAAAGDGDGHGREERPARPGAAAVGLIGFFQHFLKDTLKLEFQLEQIDYGAENFIHADMDLDSFLQLQHERGEGLLTLMVRAIRYDLARTLAGDRPTAEPGMADLLRIFLSPDSSREIKVLLARQFQDMEAMVAALEGPEGSVILTERNKVALGVLRQTLAAGKRNIGVFYGAAHLPDMDRRLREEFGFTPRGSEWRTAWNMPLRTIVYRDPERRRPAPAPAPKAKPEAEPETGPDRASAPEPPRESDPEP